MSVCRWSKRLQLATRLPSRRPVSPSQACPHATLGCSEALAHTEEIAVIRRRRGSSNSVPPPTPEGCCGCGKLCGRLCCARRVRAVCCVSTQQRNCTRADTRDSSESATVTGSRRPVSGRHCNPAAVRDRARAVTEAPIRLSRAPQCNFASSRVRYLAPLYPQLFPQHPGPSHHHQSLAWALCPGRQAL